MGTTTHAPPRPRAMDFSGRGGGGGGAGATPDPAVIMDQVKSEMAQQYLQTVRDRCFDKCVTKPGTSMSNSELTCLAKCCDRYIDATKVVSGTVAATYKQAAQQEGLGGGLH